MVKIAFAIYRSWAFEIFQDILNYQNKRGDFSLSALLTTEAREFPIDLVKKNKIPIFVNNANNPTRMSKFLKEQQIDLILFYGWSWIVPLNIINNFDCFCLHPSLLPKYKGGSPIQNQILSGQKSSGITIFKMNQHLDAGPIYVQVPMSLSGDISEIFKRMGSIGAALTRNLMGDFLDNNIVLKPQANFKKYPVFKRRKPENSKLDLSKVRNMKFDKLYDYVRALSDPYPNLYLDLNGKKLLIRKVRKYQRKSRNALVLNTHQEKTNSLAEKRLFLKIKDGYAYISEYKLLPKAD